MFKTKLKFLAKFTKHIKLTSISKERSCNSRFANQLLLRIPRLFQSVGKTSIIFEFHGTNGNGIDGRGDTAHA